MGLYKKARRRSMLNDEKKALRLSDWEPAVLLGFASSIVALIGWLPGCLIALALDLNSLLLCRKKHSCGLRLAVCGMIFALLGCFVAFGTGAWRLVGINFLSSLLAWLLLASAAALLLLGGMWLWYRLHPAGE